MKSRGECLAFIVHVSRVQYFSTDLTNQTRLWPNKGKYDAIDLTNHTRSWPNKDIGCCIKLTSLPGVSFPDIMVGGDEVQDETQSQELTNKEEE